MTEAYPFRELSVSYAVSDFGGWSDEMVELFVREVERGGGRVASAAPQVVHVRPRTYRAFQWQAEEWHKWTGRNWRRVKRERRKYMANGR